MGPLATNAQPPAATRAPSVPQQAAASGAATAAAAAGGPGAQPEGSASGCGGGGSVETPEDNAGPWAANAAAAQPAMAGGPKGRDGPTSHCSVHVVKQAAMQCSRRPQGSLRGTAVAWRADCDLERPCRRSRIQGFYPMSMNDGLLLQKGHCPPQFEAAFCFC